MLTMKKLNEKLEEKLKEIESKIPKTITYVTYIARKKIDSGTEYYEEEKQNLINRGFKLIKKEPISSLYARFMLNSKNCETETWEKEYAEGEF